MTGIYIITNTIDGKRYIGQSIDIKRRFWDHRCISHEENRHLRYAMKKYGKEAFKYEILEECEYEKLDEREIYYIDKLKPEYNVSYGGQRTMKRLPDETKEILSKKAKKQWDNKTDEEKAEFIRKNLTGPKIGHEVSEETREKLRMANIGKLQSKETIEKRKATFIKKKANGYIQTNGDHKKKIVCVETGIVFDSVKSAAESIGVNPSCVSANLKGRQKTVKNLHFKYFKV